MHEYSRDDIRECLGGKRVLFVGDSTMRVLFFAALTRLEHEAAEWLLRTTFTEANPRHDLAIDSETVQLQFIWDPWLNSTAFEDEIRLMEPGGDKDVDPALKPDLVIMGSVGLWAARNDGNDMYFDTFRTATDRVARAMGGEVRPFGKQQADNYVFLAPVTIPRYEMLLPGRAEAFSPERIRRMNSYLGSLSPTVQSHILTSYNDMTRHVPEAYEDTGLHVTASVAERWIDVPLNARCNGLLLGRPAADQPAPSLAHTTTCCAAYPAPVRGQKSLWLIICAAATVPALVFLFRGRAALLSSHISCTFVGLAALYSYVADRSHTFAKSEKHYNVGWLYSSFVLSGALFLANQRKYSQPLRRGSPSTSPHRASLLEVDFLPRHISNEWKGLLQAAFLLLAYQDSTQIPIVTRWSEFVRSSYLFLSAFGHASYFLRYSDYSFRRIASVLLRLNLLPCLLVLILDGRDTGTVHSASHLYSFIRLASFWFLVVYITLRIGSQTNRSRPHSLLLRICMSAAFLTYIILRPNPYGLFETVSRAGVYLFGESTTWVIEDMRLAVSTDWCAPYAGMVVAVVAQRAAIICDRIRRQQEQKHMLLSGQNFIRRPRTSTGPSTNGNRPFSARARANTANSTNSTNANSRSSLPDDVNVRNAVCQDAGWLDRLLIAVLYPDEFTAPLQTMIVIFSSVFFFGFASATSVSPMIDGETSHPYLTSVAVVCFAVIRNTHSQLRARYMILPAALGTMALELFVLHNHILLSGNGTGHLRLLSIYPSAVEEGAIFLDNLTNVKVTTIHCLEIISITTIFLLVGRRAHRSTRFLSMILFGESAAGDTDATISTKKTGTSASRLSAFDEEHYELPQYGDGTSSTVATEEPVKRPGPSGTATKIRTASLLVLLWGLNSFYL